MTHIWLPAVLILAVAWITWQIHNAPIDPPWGD